MPSVKVENVTMKFGGFTALDKVNINVEDREYVSIIGPSGCGKTTLLRIIAGIIGDYEGHVYVDGKLFDAKPLEERGIGYVFQNIALFPNMSVGGNVSYSPRAKGLSNSIVRTTTLEMLELMKLSERYHDYPRSLSGGMQQKTALARALASSARLLLLDEPLSLLDLKVRTELRYELRRIVKDLGLTAIHVTHDQEEAMAVSDRIIVMRRARVVEDGTPVDLYLHPKKIFTAYFLGESNVFEGNVAEADEDTALIDLGGLAITARNTGFQAGEKVIVMVRPELIELGGHISGRVLKKTLEGLFSRLILDVKGIRMIVKQPYSNVAQLGEGSSVNIRLPEEHVLVYKHPGRDLYSEISLY
ncbi:MAG: ABC transporter ATP-binding protein [Candidatus Brockarchaeota archaeon]|nr:ABC transporter ATP-binding protein [Candidatus Brockarchaeota archaeon]